MNASVILQEHVREQVQTLSSNDGVDQQNHQEELARARQLEEQEYAHWREEKFTQLHFLAIHQQVDKLAALIANLLEEATPENDRALLKLLLEKNTLTKLVDQADERLSRTLH